MYESFLSAVLSWFPDTPFYASMAQIFVVLAILAMLVIGLGIVVAIYSTIKRTIQQRRGEVRNRDYHDGPTGRRW